jgi:hypothetical protein
VPSVIRHASGGNADPAPFCPFVARACQPWRPLDRNQAREHPGRSRAGAREHAPEVDDCVDLDIMRSIDRWRPPPSPRLATPARRWRRACGSMHTWARASPRTHPRGATRTPIRNGSIPTPPLTSSRWRQGSSSCWIATPLTIVRCAYRRAMQLELAFFTAACN